MTVINVAFRTDIGNDVAGNWNNISSVIVGEVIADCIDDSGTTTGVSLENLKAWANSTSNTGIATADFHGLPEIYWDYYYYVATANDGVMLRLSGLTAGGSYTLTIAGARGSTGRDTDFNASGSTNGPLTYVNGAAGTPTAPVAIVGTVPAGGNVDITCENNDTYVYCNGFTFEYTTAGDTTAPTITSRTIDAAGTSLTLGADESITAGAGGNGGLTLSTGQTLTYASGDGTASIVYSISPAVGSSETPTLSYTQPTNGWEDAAGNDLATFSAAAITNNSTVDNIDPTLSAHTNTITNVASTPGATSNETGTADMCMYLTSEGTPPTEAEVLAGTYANMVGEQINLAVTAATPFSFTQVTGLTGNTDYTVDIYSSDAADNVSALQRTNFTTQSATAAITTDALSATLDVVLLAGAVETFPAILKTFNDVTTDGSGNLSLDLNDVSVTASQAVEGLAKDTTSGDPLPLQGTVGIA